MLGYLDAWDIPPAWGDPGRVIPSATRDIPSLWDILRIWDNQAAQIIPAALGTSQVTHSWLILISRRNLTRRKLENERVNESFQW